MIGMGVPQYRCRLISQSRRRQVEVISACFPETRAERDEHAGRIESGQYLCYSGRN